MLLAMSAFLNAQRSAKLFPILVLLKRVFLAPVSKVTFDRIEMTDGEKAIYAIS